MQGPQGGGADRSGKGDSGDSSPPSSGRFLRRPDPAAPAPEEDGDDAEGGQEAEEALAPEEVVIAGPEATDSDTQVGRRRRQEEEDFEVVRARMPRKKFYEQFGIAEQLMGASRIKVMCADGKSRLGRVPGKLRKRMWIREGDLVIVKPWEFQDAKADITYRYTKTQASYLSRKGVLPSSIDVF